VRDSKSEDSALCAKTSKTKPTNTTTRPESYHSDWAKSWDSVSFLFPGQSRADLKKSLSAYWGEERYPVNDEVGVIALGGGYE